MTAIKEPLKISVKPGCLRKVTWNARRDTRDCFLVEIDSATKYTHQNLNHESGENRRCVVIAFALTERTLRPSRSKKPTEVKIELRPGDWITSVVNHKYGATVLGVRR